MLTDSKNIMEEALTIQDKQRFKSKLFRRAIQLMMSKDSGSCQNDEGTTAPNRALANSNFRCFDFMLALMSQCDSMQTSEAIYEHAQ